MSGKEENLLGVSIQKKFIPSIANTVGTDFTKYKVVRRGQFTYIPDTSRRGDKIGIALLEDYDEGLVSNVYTVFEIFDTSKLLPKYLMLWFSRPEFDRYARFKSHGSVRELFDWDELCKVELPVPSYEEQVKIVNEYNTITDRIDLKEQINDNLTEAALTILHKYVGEAALINKTPSELEKITVPPGWNIKSVKNYCKKIASGATPSRSDNRYWENGNIPWLKSGEIHNGICISTNEFVNKTAVSDTSIQILPAGAVLMAMYGVTAGEVGYLAIDSTTNQAVCSMICLDKRQAAYLFFSLLQNQQVVSRLSNGGAQNNLNKGFIENIMLIVPTENILNVMALDKIIDAITFNTKEIAHLSYLQEMILSKLSNI